MATKLRRRARRGDGELLRDQIIDATEALLVRTSDLDAVSIRAVATAVGITAPSIYMHFDHKDDLIFAVCERNFLELDRVIREAGERTKDPVARVKAMGRAYVDFGLSHPEQYRFLFMTPTPEWAADRMQERIDDLSGFGHVVAAVQRCIDEGSFQRKDAYLLACGLWMGVHGVTSLFISKASFPWPDRDELIDHCIDGYCDAAVKTKTTKAKRGTKR
jgi:AcrR family transcriptional regulator